MDKKNEQQIRINTQNYHMACGIESVQRAAKILMDNGIEIRKVSVSNGMGTIETSVLVTGLPGITQPSSVRQGSRVRNRVVLSGCILQYWTTQTKTEEQAA